MRPNGIVVFYGIYDGFPGGLDLPERDIETEFYLEDAVDPLGDGVFIGIAVLCHRNGNEVVPEQGDVVGTAVLQSSIGMMD